MTRYELLKKQISQLIDSIGDGEECGNEVCHIDEDDIKDLFIQSIYEDSLDYHEIHAISKLLLKVPDYIKWYK